MAESKKKAVFDVSKPDAPSAPPSASGVPLIVKHQTVKDPMVNNEPQPDLPVVDTEKPNPSPSSKKIVIQPLHNTIEADDEPKANESEPEPEATPEPEPKKAKAEPTVAVPEQLLEAAADAPVIDDEQEDRERQKTIDTLIESEKYYLPIQTIEQRRTKRATALGILMIIILAVAWYDVALDAALLPNTYNLPHSNFFSTES